MLIGEPSKQKNRKKNEFVCFFSANQNSSSPFSTRTYLQLKYNCHGSLGGRGERRWGSAYVKEKIIPIDVIELKFIGNNFLPVGLSIRYHRIMEKILLVCQEQKIQVNQASM